MAEQLNPIPNKLDLSYIPNWKNLLAEHVEKINEKVNNLALSLNIPQLRDNYSLEDKRSQLIIAKAWWIQAVTVNLPLNKMSSRTSERREQVLKTVDLVKEMWMQIAIILIQWNPISGRWKTWLSTYDFTDEVIHTLDKQWLSGEVWVYSGLYPTDVTSYSDLIRSWFTWSFDEKQTWKHLSTQVQKAQKFSEDFWDHLNGFVTQIVDNPLLAAKFAEQIMKVAPGKDLYIWTSSKSNLYHLQVIRTQLAKITWNQDFKKVKTDNELLLLIAQPWNWRHLKKMLLQTLEPVNRDMLTRILSSRWISGNVMADIYQILWARKILTPEEIALIHYHMNVYDSYPKTSWKLAKEAILTKNTVIDLNNIKI